MRNEEVLLQNIREYHKNAVASKNNREYNTAVTLFFKAMASMCDLIILRREGFLPSNHNQRFRVLEEKHAEIYRILDKDFSLYQDSYRARMDRESAEIIERDVKKLSEITGIRI